MAQLMLNSPPQPLVNEDKLIWKAKKNSNYSMRSVYRICVSEIADNSHLHAPDRCNLVWKLKVPPKIKKKKNLVCHVCRGCFPTRARLRSRGVHCPTDCVICGSNCEITFMFSWNVLMLCTGSPKVPNLG